MPGWVSGLYAARFRFWRQRAQSRTTSPFSLITQTHDWGGVRWVAEIELPPMTRAQGEALHALLDSLEGTGVLLTCAATDWAPNTGVGPGSTDWILSPDSPRSPDFGVPAAGFASIGALTFLEAV